MTSLPAPNNAGAVHAVRTIIPQYHDVLPPRREASRASERAACGRTVLTVGAVPTHPVSVSAAAHVAPACGCALESSSSRKKNVGSFFLCSCNN